MYNVGLSTFGGEVNLPPVAALPYAILAPFFYWEASDMKPSKVNQLLLEAGYSAPGDARIISSFVSIFEFLMEYPDRLSGRGSPDLGTPAGVLKLFERYRTAYMKAIYPSDSSTKPDELVSLILQQVHGYTAAQCEQIKREHQHSMSAENCVGALLEKYICHRSEADGWAWCCGELVKATDFIKKTRSGWLQIQIKNRDNSENSSSSAIRNGTEIQKWFRTYSRTGQTNWDNLPPCLQGYGMSEADFHQFCIDHLNGPR